MTTKSKQRYILHKNDETTGPKICAFFLSDKGCKNGNSCKFLHSKGDIKQEQANNPQFVNLTTVAPHNPAVMPIKTVSSVPTVKEEATQPVVNSTPKTEKKKRKSSGESESEKKKVKSTHGEEIKTVPPQPVIGTPEKKSSSSAQPLTHSLPVTPFHPPSYRSTDEDEDESSFLFFAVNTALTQQTPEAGTKPVMNPPSQSKSAFSDFFLPPNEVKNITELNAHSEKVLKERRSSKKSPGKALGEPKPPAAETAVLSFGQTKQPQQSTPLNYSNPSIASVLSTTASSPIIPHPIISTVGTTVDPRASDWSKLVQQCANHSRFAKDYTFSTDSEWIQAKPYGEWATVYPPVIAIDCEMCETVDPVTETKNSNALIRVSIVNGLNPSEVLLDSLVAPSWPISEMRTRIHGITETNLTGVTFTLRHAQAFLMKICSDQTVIIGHALHHDLRALKFQHKCIIDTSYLYTIENEPNSLLSLRDIAKHLYDQKLSTHHDSVQDAQVALMLARHVKNNGTPPPIPRASSQTSTIDETMLFVHRLPLAMNEELIREMVMTMTNVIPSVVNPVHHSATTQQTPTGKTNVVFPSAAHANLCFDTLPGLDRPDKGGRSQKRVYLKGGGYICVRKA